MKNWKIGLRIAAGFAAVTAVAMALGVFAYCRVEGIGTDSTQIATISLPGVYLIGQVQNGIQKEYGLVLQFIASTSKDEMEKLDADLRESRTLNGSRRAEFQKLITSDKQRTQFDALMTARNAYVATCDEVLKIARVGNHKLASDLVIKQVKPLEQK